MLYPPSIGHFSCRRLRGPPAFQQLFFQRPAPPPNIFSASIPDPSERLIYGLSSYFNKKGAGHAGGRTDGHGRTTGKGPFTNDVSREGEGEVPKF